MKLSPHQHDALTAATSNPLRRVHDTQPGKPPWPAPAVTLHALVGRGYLTYTERRDRKGRRLQEWAITDAGRARLAPQEITRRDVPVYLSRSGAIKYKLLASGRWAVDTSENEGGSGDYTSDPRRSIDRDAGTSTAVEVLVTNHDLEQYAKDARIRESQRRAENGIALDQLSLNTRLAKIRKTARSRYLDFTGTYIAYLIRTGRSTEAADRLTAAEQRFRLRA